MFSTLIPLAHGLVGRAVPVLIALQDAARPASGGAAPASGGGASSGAGNPMFQMLLPLAMVAFLYFFMIRPASKQRKDQENLQKGIQKGDKVVTTSGIIGTVSGVDEQHIVIEIAERVRVKFLRESVARKLDAATATTGTLREATSPSTPDKKK